MGELIDLGLCGSTGMMTANWGGDCKTYNVITGKCEECSFWYWKSQNSQEGVWCESKWWFWVAAAMGIFLFAMLMFTAFNYATHKNAYEEMKVQELYISGYEDTMGAYH